MRKLYCFVILTIMTVFIFAQPPAKFSYQAVIRDADNNLIIDEAVGMQISILQGAPDGTVVYIENQNPVTNANGMVNLEIGEETGFEVIDWSDGPYFIKIETDITGGTDYSITGVSQLLSVPYALYAEKSGTSATTPWDYDNGVVTTSANVGIGTHQPNALLHTFGEGEGSGNVLFQGELISTDPGNPPASGSGTRMFWYPNKAAFRAGRVIGSVWDKDSIGILSYAMGYNALASDYGSVALGIGPRADSPQAFAMGFYSQATGFSSFALGYRVKAKASRSLALGYMSEASALGAFALGKETKASGNYAFAMGHETHASGAYSFAVGDSSLALGNNSVAMGYHSVADHDGSIAIGYEVSASGSYAVALGKNTTASGDASTAMGSSTNASGTHSIATGIFSNASGYASTAMGNSANALGNWSFAINLSNSPGPDLPAQNFRITGASSIGGNLPWTNYSDFRMKKEIQPVSSDDNLQKIMQLEGVRFRWNEHDEKIYLGFIAQDVSAIIPESVRYDELNDIYSMENTAIIPVLVEAMKEQQQQIEAQNRLIDELLERLEILENNQ